ncbi:hypothetical protein ACFWAZ_36595 [Streptomyces collinus]|uniref:MmyB family transcriptional regulator n=1 Tax=Streptomyces collinus TaxID=42684 RepID=UPI00365D0325
MRPQIQRHVASQDFGSKAIRHPELGELTFDWDSFYGSGDPDQHLTVWSPAPGSPSEEKLRILSSWIQHPATAENATARRRES